MLTSGCISSLVTLFKVISAPRLNSAAMTLCVLTVTLWVEHMAGYAGVMMGIR